MSTTTQNGSPFSNKPNKYSALRSRIYPADRWRTRRGTSGRALGPVGHRRDECRRETYRGGDPAWPPARGSARPWQFSLRRLVGFDLAPPPPRRPRFWWHPAAPSSLSCTRGAYPTCTRPAMTVSPSGCDRAHSTAYGFPTPRPICADFSARPKRKQRPMPLRPVPKITACPSPCAAPDCCARPYGRLPFPHLRSPGLRSEPADCIRLPSALKFRPRGGGHLHSPAAGLNASPTASRRQAGSLAMAFA